MISVFFKFIFSVIILVIFTYHLLYFLNVFKKELEYERLEKSKKENKDTKESYENYMNFMSSASLKNNLSNIFKGGDLDHKAYPNVQVTTDAEFFKTNKFLPECCMYYPNYSGDKGCPCITPEQQFFLHRRGGNRNVNSFVNGEKSANLYFSPTNALKGEVDKLFKQFKTEPRHVTPQDESERKKVLTQYLNIQDR